MDEKRDFENRPFFLIPPFPWFVEDPDSMDEHAQQVLNEIKEENRKSTFLSRIRGTKKYDDSSEKANLIELFNGYFDSFTSLKQILTAKGLEKLSTVIEMEPPVFSDFGVITNQRSGGARGSFAYYKLIGGKLQTGQIKEPMGGWFIE